MVEKLHITDTDVLDTLSEVGVYITNYITGDSLSSDKWKTLPKSFSTEDKSDFLKYIHEDDRDAIEKSLLDVYEGKSKYFSEIYRLIQPNGNFRWIKSYGKTVKQTEDGKPILFIGSDTDITDLKISEEKEKKSKEDLEILQQILKVISLSLDLNKTVDKILIEFAKLIPYETCSIQILRGNKLCVIGAEGFSDNEEACNMEYLYPEEGSLSTHSLNNYKPYLTNNVPKDYPAFIQPNEYIPVLSWIGVPLIAQSGIIGLLSFDGYRTNHFNENHLELCSIIGDHIAIALENAMLHENAFKLVMEDSLTGIGSRDRMKIEGRLIIETAKRDKTPLSLAIIDFDNFKLINDEFGHNIGDVVLKDFTTLCKKYIRGLDLFARYGGDVFILLMPETGSEQAFFLLDKIRLAMSKNINLEINKQVSISCGIASGIPNKQDDISDYISVADKELYISKDTGRNRVSIKEIN